MEGREGDEAGQAEQTMEDPMGIRSLSSYTQTRWETTHGFRRGMVTDQIHVVEGSPQQSCGGWLGETAVRER